jgi:hypothetical protein
MLCELCKKIKPPHQVKRRINTWKENPHACLTRHHANFDDLIRSALQGCELCNVFRPFVEHAMSKRGVSGNPQMDDGDSADSGYSHSDPFDGEEIRSEDGSIQVISETFQKYRINDDWYYEDDGEEYCWMDDREDDKNHEYYYEVEETLRREEEEDKLAGFVFEGKNSDKYEVIQWLFQDKNKYSGPEQIWITGQTHYVDAITVKGHYEASTVLTLSAGSVDMNCVMELEKSECCIDGGLRIQGTKDLAMRFPGLWKWKHKSLGIDDESDSRKLKPTFEFYQSRGIFGFYPMRSTKR